MITERGEKVILRGVTDAGEIFAQQVAFGAGDAAPGKSDTRLDFEVVRLPIDIVDFDEASMELSVRAYVPDNIAFEVREVGLLIGDARSDGGPLSTMVSFFDLSTEEWVGHDSINTDDSRVGTAGLQLDLAGGTKTLVSDEAVIDFESKKSSDEISLAYNRLGGSVSGAFRARIDESNYREYTFSLDGGYNIHTFTKGDFVEVGSAPWEDVNDLFFTFTGSDSIVVDALRSGIVAVEEEVLVARSVLTTPIVKDSATEMQLDYRIGVSFA